MPTTDPVIVPIVGKDSLTPAVGRATLSLRDMGEKVSQLGMRMTAAITVPLVLAGKSILTFGQNSSKTLSDLNKAIGDANASHDPAKIKAAWQEWNNLSPAVREAGIAYDRLQQALVPVNAEFDKAKATLLTALVPVVKELTPTIVSLAKGVSDLATGFSNLPQWQKDAILGFTGLLAVAGPVVLGIGQVASTIGTIQLLLPGFTGAVSTLIGGIGGIGGALDLALGPVGALVLAVGALIKLVTGPEGKQAWTSIVQMVGMGLRGAGLITDQQFLTGAQNAGLIAAPAGAGGNGATILNYNNYGISTANEDEAARMLAKLDPKVRRQMGR
jgi:hypothetical protein